MNRTILFFAALATLFSTACVHSNSRVIPHPRWAGDTYISKVEPVPIVQATEDGTPEAEVARVGITKLSGYVWNESGRCVITYELPPNYFEWRARVIVGMCPLVKLPESELPQEITPVDEVPKEITPAGLHQAKPLPSNPMDVLKQTANAQDKPTHREMKLGEEICGMLDTDKTKTYCIDYTLDDSKNPICEYWLPINRLVIPPGIVTPKLRAIGGVSYALNFTQSPDNGRVAYNGYYNLNVNFGLTTFRKGKRLDWGIVFKDCQAHY